jgi:copper transport protein
VIAASAWIGGLALLVLALPAAAARLDPPDRTRLLTGAVGRFSALAPVAVALLLAGGILQSVLELDALDDLWDTPTDARSFVKSVLVAGLLALGYRNRRRTLPRARARGGGGRVARPSGRTLRRALRTEVALGVAALAVTGALAGYSPSSATATYSASADLGPAHAELNRRACHRRTERGPPVPLQALGREPVGRGAHAGRARSRCRRRAARRSRSTRARPARATTSSAALP